MEKATKEQSKSGKYIERMVENYYKDSKSRKNIRYYRTRLDKLDQEWAAFTVRNAEIQQYEALNPTHPYFEEDFFRQVESTYEDLKAELEDNLQKLEGNTSTAPIPKESTDDLQRQIRTQQALMSSLDRSLQSVEEAIQTPQSRAYYQQHLASLGDYWRSINTAHHEILAEEETSAYDQSRYINLEIRYQAVAIKLMELSENSTSSEEHPQPQAANSPQHQQSMVRLPKITIPTFSGDYSKWKQFHDLFLNLIHLQPMADSQKMFYLKSNLAGEPSRLIQHLQVSEANYKTAWDLLRHRYDNKRVIVSSFLNSILSIPNMNGESASTLKRLHDTVNEAILGIKNQGLDTTNWDALLLHLLLQKVDRETHRLFEQGLEFPREIPSLNTFLKFIESRFQLLETLGERKEKIPLKDKESKKHSSFLTTKRAVACELCKRQHYGLRNCTEFHKLSISDRLKTARRMHCCVNCLQQGHSTTKCPSRGCLKCNGRHNTLLHHEEQRQPVVLAETQRSQTQQMAAGNHTVHAAFNKENKALSYVFLGTAMIDVENNYGQGTTCRAILDSGSQLNFVSERLIKKLGFKISQRQTDINGIRHFRLQSRGRINLSIQSKANGFSARIEACILPEITSNQPTQILNTTSWPIPENIQLADPDFHQPRRVDLLLGAEIYCELMSVGQIKLADDLPTLQNSVFGWIVLGKVNRSVDSSSYFCGISSASIDKQLEKFWALEECESNARGMTEMERTCENHFNKYTHRNPEGRFVVKLPFIQPPRILGNSRDIALRRFLSLEKRLEREPTLKEQYSTFMAELLDLNHMERIDEIPEYNYFLPHHCVLKPESTTTKLRVVFDGSCKASNNLSLNDILLTGPTIQDELFAILLRFRLHKYVFTADITKMYRQVLVEEDDRNFQLIIWRNNPSERLQYYRLRTVTYGTSSAPYLATKCLHRLAEEEMKNHPSGSRILKRDFYVDDVMTGSDSLSDAVKIQAELKIILEKGGFPLRKWCANHTDLLQSLPKEDVEVMINIGEKNDGQIKTLGLIWTPSSDQFSIKTNLRDIKRITKRTILADIAHIYDPLGLVNPVVTLGKCFMQQLWKLKLNWDEAIPQELHTKWLAFRDDLKNLKSLLIPRHVLSADKEKKIQMHAFSDASEKAYGAAIYIRTTNQKKCSTVKLLCAKSKVAPIKKTTLPRLELAAAHLMVKIVKQLKEIMHIRIEDTYYWTDSTITLSWITSSSSPNDTFISNRVSYIQEHTAKNKWRHVPTKLNPADLVSRGLTARQLISSSFWFTGPDFLKKDPANWPNKIPATVSKEETRICNTVLSTTGDAPTILTKTNHPNSPTAAKEEKRQYNTTVSSTTDASSILSTINHRNSFKTLQHVVCYIMRIFKRKNEKTNGKGLQASELHDALMFIIKEIQRKSFRKELKQLAKNGTVDAASKLKSVTPFLDEIGIIRVGGRLEAAKMSYDAKHPILLPHTNELVKLLLAQLHEKNLHAGPQALLAITRQQFWPLHGKSLTQSIVRNCIRCSRLRPRFTTQLMGNLPAERVQPARPFVNAGVDFCGPIHIHYKVRGKKPTKAYIAVFICFTTKAVHLELVSDLTKDAFIGALRRFIGRRGRPSKIFCDNATNFVGAKNELSEVHALFSEKDFQNNLMQYCSDEYIQWCFIPPRTPHFGGLWEAAVKSAKHHLRRTLLSASLTFEELNTVIVEIEAVLNSRPLTPLSSDPNDLQALSPGHFLIGEPLTTLANPHSKEKEYNLLQRWELVKSIQQEFWRRWSKEYLQHLQQRPKWQQASEDIKSGALVLLKDEATPPLKWALGRVVQEHKGSDGLTRVVEVKTERGIFKRAVHNLCPLPIETSATTEEENQNTPKNIGKPVDKPKVCNQQPGTAETKKPPSTSLIVSLTSPKRSKKGKLLPINSSWLQIPFKPCSQLQKYSKHAATPSLEEQPVVKKPRPGHRQLNSGQNIVTLFLAVCLVLITPGQATQNNESVEITPWEHHPLIYFEDVAQMSMITDKWNILAYYNLNGYWKEINILKNQLTKLKETCSHSSTSTQNNICKPILLQFQRHLTTIQANNDILLRRNGDGFRSKRSPLDIVGTVTNKLFGILDQEYANQMSNTINKVRDNENHLLELIKNQTSIIDSTENIIKKDREFSDNQFSDVNKYLNQLREDTNKALSEHEISQIFNAVSIHSTLMMIGYQQLQSALIEIITDCHNGKIHPLLLTPEQLRKELFLIRENIPTSLTIPGGADHTDLLQLYSLMTVQSRVTTEYVLFNINLPLLNKEIFQIFKLTPIPIKVNERFVQVRTATNFLAVSLHHDYYYLMSEEELSRCIISLKGRYICKKIHRIFHKTAGEAKCELSILNQNSELPEVCILEQPTSSSTWIQLHDPNCWIYALEQEYVLNIVCGTQTHKKTLKGVGLLKFKSNCVIKQDTITISAHSQYSSKTSNSFVPSMPMNISLIAMHLHEQEVNKAPHKLLVRNNSEDISRIKETIHHLQANQHLQHEISSETHHFTISYLALTLIVILIIAYTIKRWLNHRNHNTIKINTPPEPTPRRSNFQLHSKRIAKVENP